ncbi:MAG: universal stress protein [Actinobacteria bacterium]|nr:universal stress protein [Actinomycetota bacterium]
MRPILLVTDCSAGACDACHEAVELARATGAPLLAVAVAHVTYPTVGYSVVGYSTVAAMMEEVRKQRTCEALDEVEKAAGAAGLERVTLRTAGPDAAAIRGLAIESDARMIVVPARARLAQELLQDHPCPVLVVGSEQPAAAAVA